MFGIKTIASAISGAFKFFNKLIPSWAWRGGKATAERDQARKGLDDVEKGRTAADDLDNSTRRRLRRKYGKRRAK